MVCGIEGSTSEYECWRTSDYDRSEKHYHTVKTGRNLYQVRHTNAKCLQGYHTHGCQELQKLDRSAAPAIFISATLQHAVLSGVDGHLLHVKVYSPAGRLLPILEYHCQSPIPPPSGWRASEPCSLTCAGAADPREASPSW